MDLTKKKCVPCEGWEKPFDAVKIKKYQKELPGGWEVITPKTGGKRLKKKYDFKTFKESIVFINKIAKVAESEGHHPDIHNYYNKVIIELTTHAIDGLSENDFILAAKIEKLV